MTAYQHKVLRPLLSKACLARDNHECIRCGATSRLSASHIYPKGSYRSMEYDLDNVKTLCYRCHLHFWHKNPMEAKEWLVKTLPKSRLDRLLLMSQQSGVKLDYNLTKIYLEQQLKKYS